MSSIKLFSGTSNQSLARGICKYLNIELSDINIERFPDGEIGGWVAVVVLQVDFFDQPSFAHVFAVCAAEPHAHFAGGVAAQDGTVVDEDDAGPVPRRRHGGAHPRDAAADNADV